jgi:spore coat protein A, manganese oxidase
MALLSCVLLSSFFILPVFSQSQELLDPATIPKWVNQLDGPPPVFVPENILDNDGNIIRQDYVVSVAEFYQQILPTVDAEGNPTGFAPTKVWGYGGEAMDTVTGENLGTVYSTPGPTFEAIQGIPTQVKWVNNLVDAEDNPLPHLFVVDPTLHWANPNGLEKPTAPVTAPFFPPGYPDAQTPVPIVTHLHGGEVPSASDGHPDAWWTPNSLHGPAYNSVTPTDANAAVYNYPNSQPPTTLWYHDHALGITRMNVLAGLAGFYLLRNPSSTVAELLPSGEYEVPLVIQDRSFLSDGSIYFPSEGNNPTIHPYWQPAYLGNTIMVNGKVWPNMNVKQGLYRLRLLDGSNARFYSFSFSNGMSFQQIGTDGGYLKSPVELTSLILAPAERADILVDFSNIPAGETVTLQNSALTDFQAEGETLGQIMQFTVTNETGFTPKLLPSNLNPTLADDFPSLPPPEKERILTLTEETGPNGQLALLLDGQKWGAPISETPVLGTTEDWVIANPTLDPHPIHLHLVQFQIVYRQGFNSSAYLSDWKALNGEPPLDHPTKNVPSLDPYLIGEPADPPPNEQGWKDTAIAYNDKVTVIRIRFTSQDGSDFPFDATVGPGYVWHCHILDHEDNEMMRPLTLTAATAQQPPWLLITIAVIVIVGASGLVFLGFKYLKHRSS